MEKEEIIRKIHEDDDQIKSKQEHEKTEIQQNTLYNRKMLLEKKKYSSELNRAMLNKDRISIKNQHKKYLEEVEKEKKRKKKLQEEAKKEYERVIKWK